MRERDVARRAHRNMVDAFAHLPAHQPNGRLWRDGGVVVVSTGSPIATFNELLAAEDEVDAAALAEGVRILRTAGAPWLAHVRADTQQGIVPTLVRLGLEEIPAFYPAMVLTEPPAASALPAGIEIRELQGDGAFETYLNASAAIAGAEPDLFATWLSRGLVEEPGVAVFLGYVGGVAVSKSMSIATDGVVGVYDVGTLESARRRGYGWALTEAAVSAGFDAGCTLATLQASEMGYPIYAAHGFTTVFDYRRFRDPPSP